MTGPHSAQDVVESARDGAQQAAEDERLDTLARVGFTSRAAVYVVVGLLAFTIAGVGPAPMTEREVTTTGALEAVSATPVGTVLLVALLVGLLGYALWRLAEALGGHREETGYKRAFWRVLDLGHMVFHVVLGLSAVRILVTGSAPDQESSTDALSTRFMQAPGGQWIVGGAGVVAAVIGIVLVVVGVRRDFMDPFKEGDMGRRLRLAVQAIGAFGHVTRGLVFVLIGAFVVRAAVQFDPKEARGFDGALRQLLAAPAGVVLVTAAGLGLVAFGLYSLAEARYRRT